MVKGLLCERDLVCQHVHLGCHFFKSLVQEDACLAVRIFKIIVFFLNVLFLLFEVFNSGFDLLDLCIVSVIESVCGCAISFGLSELGVQFSSPFVFQILEFVPIDDGIPFLLSEFSFLRLLYYLS